MLKFQRYHSLTNPFAFKDIYEFSAPLKILWSWMSVTTS